MLNQKGNSTLEMLPVLVIFLLLVNFGMGFFGIIHSGILNSIAARNYAFETFRNRTNLNYLRDENSTQNVYYSKLNFRLHGITDENAQANHWQATKRPIRFTDVNTGVTNSSTTLNDHNTVRLNMTDDTKRTSEYFQGQTAQDNNDGVSPVWIMTSYGICLNPVCEG